MTTATNSEGQRKPRQVHLQNDLHERAPLNAYAKRVLTQYFEDLNGHKPANLYHLVLQQVEGPLLETVMNFTAGNQTQAAEILGINRSTLRKKLAQYGLEK